MFGQVKQKFFCWKFFCLVVLFLIIFSFDNCYALVGKTGKNYDFRVVGLNVGNFSIGDSGTAQGTEGLSKDLKKFFVDEDADIYMLSEWDSYFNASKGIKSVDEFSSYLKNYNYYIMPECGFGLKNSESYMAQINIIKKRSGFEVDDYCSRKDHSVGKLRGFVVNRVNVNERIVHFITVHFSFDSVDNRKKQFDEVVKYIKDNKIIYFVIAGDMNLGLGNEKDKEKGRVRLTVDDVNMFNKVGYVSAQGNKIIKDVFDLKNEVCTQPTCERNKNCEGGVENSHCRYYKYPETGEMYYFLSTKGQNGYYDNVILSNNLEFTYVYYAGKCGESGIKNREPGVLSDHLAIVADIAFKPGATNSGNSNSVTNTLTSNEYRVYFNGNNHTSGTTNSVICKKNSKCRLTKNAYTRIGYKFIGWSEKKNSNGEVDYKDNSEVKNLTNSKTVTLYAVWKANKIHIKYHVAGGKIKDSTTTEKNITYNWSKGLNDLIFRNGRNFALKDYGTTLEKGLVNWNNASGVYITNGKKVAAAKEEWCTEPNGGGVCYDQEEVLEKIGTNNRSNKLCDARKDDCSIDLYVNWVDPGVIVRYFPNGGNVTNEDRWVVTDKGIRYKSNLSELTYFAFGLKTLKYGLVNWNNVGYLNIARDGYIAVKGREWCTDPDGKGKCFNQSEFNTSIYDLCDKQKKSCIIYLYVNWIPNTFTVLYDSNGGTKIMSSHSCEIGKKCALRKNAFKRSGYTFKGWKKNNSGKLLSEGADVMNAGKIGTEVKYYAQWTANKK